MDGKVLLETRSRVAVAPDGNGGLYAALRQPLSPADKSRTVLADLDQRKVLYVHSYCVDNCLVKIADPVFLGYCIQKQADCAAKVVPKAHPTESVGVVARRGDKFSVVEYSEISKEQAERRTPAGELAFRAGNIANHFYTTPFLRSTEAFEDELAFHIARKKIPHVDLATGESVKPAKPNGMKLEMFVFDVFPFTKRFAVLEVARAEGEEGEDLEEKALMLAIDEVYEASGKRWRPWAANGRACRLGEIILLVDSDTVVPEDCLRDAAREMAECPTVAIIQHESGECLLAAFCDRAAIPAIAVVVVLVMKWDR